MRVPSRGGRRGDRASRSRIAIGLLATAIFAGGCEDGANDEGRTSNGGVSRDEAYEMVVQGVKGDPAITEGLPRETFDVLARTACETLDAGGSVQDMIGAFSSQPTQSGMPMRRESAEAILSAGVRGYCPQHSSQLR